MTPFTLRAVNTAADAENRIHDDRVAAEFGFRGGLVPGVTVYGYMTAPVIDYFGPEWLEHGAMDVRFHQPVYQDEQVSVTLTPEAGGRVRVEAGASASGVAWLNHDTASNAAPSVAIPGDRKIPSIEALAAGTVLGTLHVSLDLAHSTISAPLHPAIHGAAQPAVLLALANEIFVRNYELGPWIHVSSEVRKFHSARDGEPLCVCGRIENRSERRGHELVTFEVDISGPHGPVEHIRHTAIWRPRVSRS